MCTSGGSSSGGGAESVGNSIKKGLGLTPSSPAPSAVDAAAASASPTAVQTPARAPTTAPVSQNGGNGTTPIGVNPAASSLLITRTRKRGGVSSAVGGGTGLNIPT